VIYAITPGIVSQAFTNEGYSVEVVPEREGTILIVGDRKGFRVLARLIGCKGEECASLHLAVAFLDMPAQYEFANVFHNNWAFGRVHFIRDRNIMIIDHTVTMVGGATADHVQANLQLFGDGVVVAASQTYDQWQGARGGGGPFPGTKALIPAAGSGGQAYSAKALELLVEGAARLD